MLQAGGAPVRAALRYERSAVLGGQVWRLVTAHFVHLGWTHCLLNLAAFGLCVLLSRGRLSGRFWWGATGGLAAGIGIALLLGSPEVANYVGLSGVVYGLFVCVLGPQAWRGNRGALIVLLLVLARIAWQVLVESPASQRELIGGIVIAQAHVYGAVCGFSWVIGHELSKRRHGLG
ncbi:MAG: rhombosortase [Ideonella sp.]